MTISEEFKQKLKEKNLTQAKLAKRLNVSTAAMALFVNGKMTSARLERGLARALGVKLEELRGNQQQAS